MVNSLSPPEAPRVTNKQNSGFIPCYTCILNHIRNVWNIFIAIFSWHNFAGGLTVYTDATVLSDLNGLLCVLFVGYYFIPYLLWAVPRYSSRYLGSIVFRALMDGVFWYAHQAVHKTAIGDHTTLLYLMYYFDAMFEHDHWGIFK